MRMRRNRIIQCTGGIDGHLEGEEVFGLATAAGIENDWVLTVQHLVVHLQFIDRKLGVRHRSRLNPISPFIQRGPACLRIP